MIRKFLFSLLMIFSVFAQNLEDRLEGHIHFDPDGTNYVGFLELEMERPIDSSTYLYVKFALESFKKKGAKFVVLKLNTPGGEVFAAQKIAHILQISDIQDRIPIVAYIDNWAISAGAILAYSCRFIGNTPQASMGAAEPVHMSGGEMASASEKVNSAIRSEFRNLASFYHRDPSIAEAMVDKDLILVWRGNEVVKLKNEEQIQPSDDVITEKGKLLTLDAEKLMKYQVSDFEVPADSVGASVKEMSAKDYPIFKQPFFSKIPNPVFLEYSDWKISFFSFLSHPGISSLLFLGMMIGFYVEVNTPGFGIPGSIAAACLALVLLSSFSMYAVHWLELIILIVGILLLGVELFLIPGFGVAGILGILLIISGLFALILPSFGQIEFSIEGPENLAAYDFFQSLVWLCGALIFGFILIALLARFVMPRFRIFSPLVLKGEQESKKGYVAGIQKENLPKEGEVGEAYSSLRPSGKILIGDEIYDAIAEGGFIDKREKVIISQLEGNNVIVRKHS